MLDEAKTRNKVVKDVEKKDAEVFRLFSPQLNMVIEAKNKQEREQKVQELLHANQQE